jgi:hypothetical protein
MAIGKLFGAARNASEYVRRRMSRSVQAADEVASARTSQAERSSLAERLGRFVFGRRDRQPPATPVYIPPGSPQQRGPSQPPIWPGGSEQDRRTGAPPTQPGFPPPPLEQPPLPPGQPPQSGGSQPPPPPPPRPPVGTPDDDDGDDIQLLGRDAGYHLPDWAAVMAGMRLTPGSSNVFGYYFEFESRTRGILYVTFLAVGVGNKRSGAGQTYAYYDVPGRKYHQFARASDSSAGGAVWDYLRVRGTIAGHQHNYRLVQSHGDYVPRKVTPLGYKTRNVTEIGITGRRSYRRSTLPERLFARPNRGTPDRGTPDRGDQQ